MGLNLSRGQAIKYYSSDRITQIVGNGLVCLIDEKTKYRDFFNDKEMIFYKSTSDLSEKILKLASDDKLRRQIGRNGKMKYMKYFNSDLVSKYIIDRTLDVKLNKNYLWEKIKKSSFNIWYNWSRWFLFSRTSFKKKLYYSWGKTKIIKC